MMALINLRNALMAGKRTPTAKDYVQDGLVAMWDGIENAGWGVHDASATGWLDLTGNEGLVTAIGTPTWTDNAFDGARDTSTAVATYFASNSNNLGDMVQTGIYSIEIVVTSDTKQESNGGLFSIGGSQSRQFWIWEANNVRDFFIDAIQSAQGPWGRPSDNARNKSYVYQFILNGTEGYFYTNGSLLQSRAYNTKQMQSNGFMIARIPTYNTTRSKIHSIRLYSRALPADEIARNYAIDKVRFNLP